MFCGCASHEFHPYVGQQQKWPTSPGAFVDSQYAVLVYYGCPAQPYTVIGYLEDTSHGRFSNAVEDAAKSAKQLGADAIVVQSHGKTSEPIGALTNATIFPNFADLARQALRKRVYPPSSLVTEQPWKRKRRFPGRSASSNNRAHWDDRKSAIGAPSPHLAVCQAAYN